MRPLIVILALVVFGSAYAQERSSEEPLATIESAPSRALPLGTRSVPALLSVAERDALRRAFNAVDAGRWEEAHALAAGHPLGAKIIRWFDMQRPAGGYGFDAIADFIARNPSWPAQETLLRRAEEVLATSNDDARVRQWFADRQPLTGTGALRLAEALQRSGDRQGAGQLIRTAWRDMPLGERQEQDILQRFAGYLTAADRWARVDRAVWDKRFSDAQRLASTIEPGERALVDARIKLARDSIDGPDAVQAVPAALARDPGLLYERARYNRRNGFEPEALVIHQQSQLPLGRPQIWWREREWFVRRLLRDGRNREAFDLASRHGLSPEHGQPHAEAQFLMGWIALRRLNQPDHALTSFGTLHATSRFPVTLARAAYWAGRADEAAGRHDAARDWYRKAAAYPVTYYGQLALLQLPPNARPAAAPIPVPSREERAEFDRSELARAARLLSDIDETDRMKHFLRRLVDVAQSPAQHRAVAQLALGLGRPDLAVSVAKRSAQRAGVMVADEGWPMIDLPSGEAPERALVLATIRQESAFEADAVSPVGARGLMQLMPATARGEAAKLGRRDHSLLRLTSDPAYNVTLGSSYLSGLLGLYNGSPLLALAAYNAGPGRAAQWIRENGDPRSTAVDAIDWVEMITIEETRNYVQRVIENQQIYRRKLGQRNWVAQLERDLGRERR